MCSARAVTDMTGTVIPFLTKRKKNRESKLKSWKHSNCSSQQKWVSETSLRKAAVSGAGTEGLMVPDCDSGGCSVPSLSLQLRPPSGHSVLSFEF